MTALLETLETPDGPFTILASAEGTVFASGWTVRSEEIIERLPEQHRPSEVSFGQTGASEAVGAYYAGDLEAVMKVPVLQFGTALQLRGWQQLRNIVPGQPMSYTEFAASLNAPQAVRAAASICANNAPALFVPCHRVVRADGSLGGFAWGLAVKESLLAREKAL
jgi:methylated-DNA-[protein]-cysteine S-methyltransferase